MDGVANCRREGSYSLSWNRVAAHFGSRLYQGLDAHKRRDSGLRQMMVKVYVSSRYVWYVEMAKVLIHVECDSPFVIHESA